METYCQSMGGATKMQDDAEETKCETCGVGLNRTEIYGRNICDNCEEKLLG